LKRLLYLLNRAKWALISIGFVIILNFFLFRVLPGDPSRAGVRDPRLTAQAQQALRQRFGLDKPVINCFETLNPLKLGSCLENPLNTQFFIYVANLLRGDLGTSYQNGRPVSEILGEALLNTVLLVGIAQLISVFLGIFLGLLAAWKSRTVIDFFVLVASLVAWSLPTFWLGIMLLFGGSYWLNLPVMGKITAGADFGNNVEMLWDLGRHLILPTLTFSIVVMGEYMLIMRSTALEVLSEDYILTAKAKGLSTYRILKDHALRNAMLPMVTLIALNLGFTVAGAIQIEAVFSWPGLGLAIFDSVGRRDYPVLQGAFLLIAFSVILANLIADLLYSYLDPRIQAENNG
jgi:peptide/nickel transport system permease protein